MALKLYSCLNKILLHYNDGGNRLKCIHFDPKANMKEVKDELDIKINYSLAG